MRAIVIKEYGPVEGLVYQELPEPEPQLGHVIIQIKAFGINHAEMHMRRGKWAESAPVSGIECVGIVKACPSGEFKVGQKVAALMGGLGIKKDPVAQRIPMSIGRRNAPLKSRPIGTRTT